ASVSEQDHIMFGLEVVLEPAQLRALAGPGEARKQLAGPVRCQLDRIGEDREPRVRVVTAERDLLAIVLEAVKIDESWVGWIDGRRGVTRLHPLAQFLERRLVGHTRRMP